MIQVKDGEKVICNNLTKLIRAKIINEGKTEMRKKGEVKLEWVNIARNIRGRWNEKQKRLRRSRTSKQ